MAARCLLLVVIFGMAACADVQEFTTEHVAPADDRAPAPPPDGAIAPSCDTAHDAENCGACGHRCLGGACLSGVCQPIELARESTPMSLAVSGDEVTFLTVDVTNPAAGVPAAIRRVSTHGGVVRTIATFSSNSYGAMAMRDGYVYASYVRDHTFAIGRLGPGDLSFTDIVSRPESWGCQPIRFAVTSSSIVFNCDRSLDGVFACPLTGCDGTKRTLDLDLSTHASSSGLVALGDDVLTIEDGTSKVRRVSAGGGSCDLGVDVKDANMSEVAFDGATAFVGRMGSLLRVEPTCGIAKTTVLTTSARVEDPHLAVNKSDVLWGEQSLYDGSLWRCPKTGCAEPEMLVTGQGFVMKVVATDDAVYWLTVPRVGSSPSPGTVMKLALPPRPVPSLPLKSRHP